MSTRQATTHLAQLVTQVVCCWLLLLWALLLLLGCSICSWGCLPLTAPLLWLGAAFAGAMPVTAPGSQGCRGMRHSTHVSDNRQDTWSIRDIQGPCEDGDATIRARNQ
jgi:hypothetical protein